VQVLSRSEDPVALLLDAAGGVREEAQPPGRAVLTDALVRGLAETGQRVQRLLGPAPQDIEWAVEAKRVVKNGDAAAFSIDTGEGERVVVAVLARVSGDASPGAQHCGARVVSAPHALASAVVP
jgi:hypothetical protein